MGQGRLLLLFFCGVGEKPGGLDLEEQREKRRSMGRQPSFLAGMVCGLAEMPLEVRGWDEAVN